jgi:hypothetical protein
MQSPSQPKFSGAGRLLRVAYVAGIRFVQAQWDMDMMIDGAAAEEKADRKNPLETWETPHVSRLSLSLSENAMTHSEDSEGFVS